MTEKQLSFTMVSNSVVRRPAPHGRRAVLDLFARLLNPADRVQTRLRQAQSSLDAAMRLSPPTRPSH